MNGLGGVHGVNSTLSLSIDCQCIGAVGVVMFLNRTPRSHLPQIKVALAQEKETSPEWHTHNSLLEIRKTTMELSTAIGSFLGIFGASTASTSEETVSGVDKTTYGGFEDHLKNGTKSLCGLQAGEGTFVVTFANDDGDLEAKAQGLANMCMTVY